jgi:hypothetical protein
VPAAHAIVLPSSSVVEHGEQHSFNSFCSARAELIELYRDISRYVKTRREAARIVPNGTPR